MRESALLRVGASVSSDRVQLQAGEPIGPEPDLIHGFADSLGAQVRWRVDGEEELVTAMEHGEIDVMIGGLTARSPWADKIALTRPYASSTDHGQTAEHVLAVPLGENAMLVALERYLDEADR